MPSLRQQALSIFQAALKAADPAEALRRHLQLEGEVLLAGGQPYSLSRFERIYVLGGGKAAGSMGQAAERLLGKRITAGYLNTKYGHTAPLRRIELNECGHPVPDEAGIAGSRRIAELASQATASDLVICLISGGASALMPYPAEGITLTEKQETTKLLLASGATIHEINAVRKHLSMLKGGQLARLAAPATVLTLILSDVIGDNLDVIGSGPTAPDSSTFDTAMKVLKRYKIVQQVPKSVRRRFEAGIKGSIPDTPKPGAPLFKKVRNLVIGSNRLAVAAARQKAESLGFRTLVLSTTIHGEAREVALVHAGIAREIRDHHQPLPAPACVISGGETTVTLRGNGKGGRAQEFALAAAIDLKGIRDTVVLCGGTDGTDGPTDAAGALCDGTTVTRGRELGMDANAYLADNNSYPFFDSVGDLIRTGPTGTNVMDIHMVLMR